MTRTRFSPWQFRTSKEGGDQMKFVELVYESEAHAPTEEKIYRIPFTAGLLGLQVNTIRVESEVNISFVVSVMDGATDAVIYQGNEASQMHYDAVIIPYKSDDRALYVRIFNKGSLATKFKITIRGIEVG